MFGVNLDKRAFSRYAKRKYAVLDRRARTGRRSCRVGYIVSHHIVKSLHHLSLVKPNLTQNTNILYFMRLITGLMIRFNFRLNQPDVLYRNAAYPRIYV